MTVHRTSKFVYIETYDGLGHEQVIDILESQHLVKSMSNMVAVCLSEALGPRISTCSRGQKTKDVESPGS